MIALTALFDVHYLRKDDANDLRVISRHVILPRWMMLVLDYGLFPMDHPATHHYSQA